MRTCRSRRPAICVLLGGTTLPACPPPSDAPTGPALLHHATGDPACPPQPRAGPCHWVARCLGEGWTLERPARRPASAWADVGAARDARESLTCIISNIQSIQTICMHSNRCVMGASSSPVTTAHSFSSSHPSFISRRRARVRPAGRQTVSLLVSRRISTVWIVRIALLFVLEILIRKYLYG